MYASKLEVRDRRTSTHTYIHIHTGTPSRRQLDSMCICACACREKRRDKNSGTDMYLNKSLATPWDEACKRSRTHIPMDMVRCGMSLTFTKGIPVVGMCSIMSGSVWWTAYWQHWCTHVSRRRYADVAGMLAYWRWYSLNDFGHPGQVHLWRFTVVVGSVILMSSAISMMRYY